MNYTEEQNVCNLNVGDIVTLSDVWDGGGDVPTESCSYWLGEEDGIETWINYEFEFLTADGMERASNHNLAEDAVENVLALEVRITNIELL